MVALSIAFNQVGGTGPVTWLIVADAFGSCVYLLDLVMGFHTGVLVRWDSRALVVRGGCGCFLVSAFVCCCPCMRM
jgi:hypothetical protein